MAIADIFLSKKKVGRMEIPHMKFETFLPIYKNSSNIGKD